MFASKEAVGPVPAAVPVAPTLKDSQPDPASIPAEPEAPNTAKDSPSPATPPPDRTVEIKGHQALMEAQKQREETASAAAAERARVEAEVPEEVAPIKTRTKKKE